VGCAIVAEVPSGY